MKAYRYRLYLSKAQETLLRQHLWLAKELHNELLEFIKFCYQEYGKFPTKRTLQQMTMNSGLYSQTGQEVAHRVEAALWRFIQRKKVDPEAGFPRFKSFDRVKSLSYPQSGFKLSDKLEVTPFGSINIRKHREVEGTIKTLTLKRMPSGKWFAIFTAGQPPVEFKPNGKPKVGVDLGLKAFATLSTGERITNPRFYEKEELRLARLQRELSNKKKSSKNSRKARRKVAVLHERIADSRNDFLHKQSIRLVKEYSLIVMEGLNAKEMAGQQFGKQINDASWNNFANMIRCKAESAGCEAVFVEPRGTTRKCSKCGLEREMPLSQRTFACDGCGLILDRDVNAAINILNRATAGMVGSNASGNGIEMPSLKEEAPCES